MPFPPYTGMFPIVFGRFLPFANTIKSWRVASAFNEKMSGNISSNIACACCSKLLFIILEMFWLAVQGLVAPIAISSLVVLFTVSVVKMVIKAKGDDAMGSKVKEFVSVVFDILYTMSANLVGGALLAKTFQRIIV